MSDPCTFVLELLRGDTSARNLPATFAGNANCWASAIDYATSIYAELPFVVRARRALWAEELAPETQKSLEELERRERIRLALLDCELSAALEALQGARIPVLLLKGADLARRFYPERILRPMGDVDLLVPTSRYPEAWRVLEAARFRPTEHRFEHSFRSALARSPDGPSIDLHFNLIAGDTPKRIDRIWGRSLKGAFSDLPESVRALSAEDCLVYVLRHSAVLHVLEGAIWLMDLDFLVRGSPGLDWDFVLRELERTRSRAAAWFVFGLLLSHWNTPIPAHVMGTLERAVGLLRRRAAGLRPGLLDWFPERRERGWTLRSRYLLRENATEAARFAWERWRRKRHERMVLAEF